MTQMSTRGVPLSTALGRTSAFANNCQLNRFREEPKGETPLIIESHQSWGKVDSDFYEWHRQQQCLFSHGARPWPPTSVKYNREEPWGLSGAQLRKEPEFPILPPPHYRNTEVTCKVNSKNTGLHPHPPTPPHGTPWTLHPHT